MLNQDKNFRLLIVGGVAGGASCAARARRLSENAHIIVFDRGPYVSFANCGLPYYVGNVIQDEKKLLVATPELFKERFNIDVRLRHDVVRVDAKSRIIEVMNLDTGARQEESYDALVLAPGASALRPTLPGIQLPGIFALRTIPDSRRIKEWMRQKPVRRAVVVGAGFIGLEMAENLVAEGIQVSMVEMAPQVMPPLDPEMAKPIESHLREKGVQLFLGDGVAGFEEPADGGLTVRTKSGAAHATDMVILALGVKPETSLAVGAGLTIGPRGGIAVDERMQTSDSHVWAVGDAVEVEDFVTKAPIVLPLAGPANRQGRVAADNILGRDARFRGVQGTAVCKVFDRIVAMTGASEKILKRLNLSYEKIYLHPGNHAGYYPGAKPMHIKLLFDPKNGKVLGAQGIGEEGVEKRVDVIAMAIQMGGTVFDLAEAELCYAPQFGAAKDPVNVAGMIAMNALRKDAPVAHWENLQTSDVCLLDVRDPEEFAEGHPAGAINIPLNHLRERMSELPKEKTIWTYCRVGQRGYYATRALRLMGFEAKNITGGMESYNVSSSP